MLEQINIKNEVKMISLKPAGDLLSCCGFLIMDGLQSVNIKYNPSPLWAFSAVKSICSQRRRRKLELKAASRSSSLLMSTELKTVCCSSLQPHNYKSADLQPAYERNLLCIVTITLIQVVMETWCKPGQKTGTHNALK